VPGAFLLAEFQCLGGTLMINQILEAVRQAWPTLEIDWPVPNHVYYVLQSRRRVIFFLFAPDNTHHPLVVVKMNRDPAQNHLLEQSVERAQQVRTLLDPDMQATVPSMKLLEPINGLVGVAEKALPGRPFDTSTVSDTMLANGCHAFADWLVHFQACTRSSSLEITRGVLESLLLPPLEGLPGADDTHKSLVEDIAEALVGLQVPLVWAYGDAHPSNILLNDGVVSGVVDWEGAAPGQWPVFDWFQFMLSLAQELIKAQYPSMNRLQRETAACELLIGQPNTRLAAILHQQTTRFLSAINLHPELVLPLFLVFLIGYYWFDGKEALVQQVVAQL
jgi:hypothetical protein